MVVKWLRSALGDLTRIAAHIGQDNPSAAQALLASIREQTSRLAAFPFLGRASERDDIRELVVHQNYLVSYRVRRDAIEILQIWHTALDRGGRTF
jgi:toxin ParE1/3/4